MTLIAINTQPDCVEFITDSLSYTPGSRNLGRCVKATHLPHLDGAVLTQGDLVFGADVTAALMTCGSGDATASTDQLLDSLPSTLLPLWEERQRDQRRTAPEASIVFLVGHSPLRGRFGAWLLASEDAFKPVEIDGTFIHPCPIRYRPSDIELRRAGEHADLTDDEVEDWRNQPPVPAPTDGVDWIKLAVIARQERALDLNPHLKVLVGGPVFHTYLTREGAATTRLFEFNDSGEEFQRLVAGTLHPQGQLGACPCGSGERLIDCCLVPALDELCACGAGKPLRACCAVADPDEAPQPAADVLEGSRP